MTGHIISTVICTHPVNFQVLKYCYTLKVSVNENNMLGVLYAAEKYMLPGLMEATGRYVYDRINETNWLKIFNATHLLSCTPIIEKCVNIFQEEPMKSFEDCSFFDLCLSALRMLVELPKMNCTGADLKSAVVSWFVANDFCKSKDDCDENLLLKHGLRAVDFEGKQLQSMIREGALSMVLINFQINKIFILILKERWVSGVGLCLGVSGSCNDELVELSILQNAAEICTVKRKICTVKRKVKQFGNPFFMDIMFNKKKVLPGTLRVKVKFEAERSRFASTDSVCKNQSLHVYQDSSFYHSNSRDKCPYNMIAEKTATQFSCVAYLIYAAP
jgi:hypothetical protein